MSRFETGGSLPDDIRAAIDAHRASQGRPQSGAGNVTFVEVSPPAEQPIYEAPQAGQITVGGRLMPPSIQPTTPRTRPGGELGTSPPTNMRLTEADRQAVIASAPPAPSTPQPQRQVAVATTPETVKPSSRKDIMNGGVTIKPSRRHGNEVPEEHHEAVRKAVKFASVGAAALGAVAGLAVALLPQSSDRAEAENLATGVGGTTQTEDFVPTEVQEAPSDTPGPEALTPENCMGEGAAVATIFVSGRMPLDYATENPEHAAILNSYFEGVTESGKAEFQMENIPIKIYACEDGVTDTATTGAVTEDGGKYAVNFNRIRYDALAPTTYNGIVETDYIQQQGEDPSLFLGHAPNGVQRLYWPNVQLQYEIIDESEVTDKDVKALDKEVQKVNAFNNAWVNPDADPKDRIQTKAVTDTYRAAVASVLAQAGVASEGSVFNQTCVFNGDWQNVAGAIKEGTERRVGGNPDDVGSTGAVQNLGGDAYKKISVDGLQLSEDRTGWFETTKCEVYTGDITAVGQAAVIAAISGGSN